MAKNLLTAHKVRSICASGVYKDGAGLRLVVKETMRGERTKRWELWIAINGKRCELGLGVYPEVSLNGAREEADRIRRAARDGIDLRQQRLNDRARACTFREAFGIYFEIKRKQLSNVKHLKQWPRTMETYVFPYFGDVPVADVTMEHVLDALKPIWFEKPETAKRVLQRVEAVFKSAIRRRAREKASPCVGIVDELGTRHREVQHHAALAWQDVPTFVAMLQRPGRRLTPVTRLAFEFLILTATRSGETRGAAWSEFDLNNAIWLIPKVRMMKSRKAHRVPLSDRCVDILREVRTLNPDGLLVFEGMKKGRPLSDMTFTKLLRDNGLGERATAHGFRSSFKDWCSEVEKVADDVSEAALAHTIRGVKAAYLRTDFFDERRPLMEAWARHCNLQWVVSSSGEPARRKHVKSYDLRASMSIAL